MDAADEEDGTAMSVGGAKAKAMMEEQRRKSQALVQAALANFIKENKEYVQQPVPGEAEKAGEANELKDRDSEQDKTEAKEGEATVAEIKPSKDADTNIVPQANRFRYITFSLREVNPHIVCKLCAGYFISATTIKECLHTFCKSCIVKHIHAGNTKCPTCEKEIHETNPLEMLKQDRTIQNVVYKIVKNLQKDEEEREREFNEKLGLVEPSRILASESNLQDNESEKPIKRLRMDNEDDELIEFLLLHETKSQWDYSEGVNESITKLAKPFIRTSAQATIKHVKRFLALKLGLESHEEVDVLCRGQLMGREHKLQYIHSTWWRGRNDILVLEYRQKCDIDQI